MKNPLKAEGVSFVPDSPFTLTKKPIIYYISLLSQVNE